MIFTNSLLIFSTLNIFFLKFLFYPSLYNSLSGNGYFPFFFLHFTSFWENKWNGDDTHLIKSNIYFLKSLIIIKNEKNGGDLYSPSPHSLGIPSRLTPTPFTLPPQLLQTVSHFFSSTCIVLLCFPLSSLCDFFHPHCFFSSNVCYLFYFLLLKRWN